MFRFPKTLSSLTSLFLIASVLFASTSAAQSKFDMTVPASYGLGPCTSATEMECIESIEVRSEGKSFSKGIPIKIPSGKVDRTDEQGNLIYDNNSNWQTSEGLVNIVAHIDSYEAVPVGAVLRLHINMPGESKYVEMTFRVTIRESLLRPMNVQLLAINSNTKVESYQGGRRWILEGRPRTTSNYDFTKVPKKEVTLPDGTKSLDYDFNWSMKAHYDRNEWNFYIHHADLRSGRGYFRDEPACADKGFSITSFNAPAAGDPFWDQGSDSLNFAIAAPAYRADGSRNLGFFYYSTTHQYLDCKFKENKFGSDSKLVLEIIAEDGTTKVATTSIRNTDDRLEFFAAGFTYSSPKVILREARAGETPTSEALTSEDEVNVIETKEPSPSDSPSQTVIASNSVKKSCVKGKMTKSLPLHKKKCPKGWKKKIG